MYTLETSVGKIWIRFQHTKDHRELMGWLEKWGETLPETVNLFRIARATLCVLEIGSLNEDDPVLRTGLSFCSWLDSFDPDKGKVRALKDALANTYLTREQRAELWTAFFAAKPDREHKRGLVQVEVGV